MVEKQPQLRLITSIHGNIFLIQDNSQRVKSQIDVGAVTTNRDNNSHSELMALCPSPHVCKVMVVRK